MDLTRKIEQWAIDRNLHTADPVKQMLKLIEEVGEIASGMARGNMDEIKDGIGDVNVVTTILKKQIKNSGHVSVSGATEDMLHVLIDIGKVANSIVVNDDEDILFYVEETEYSIARLAKRLDTSVEECTQLAYDEIKDRKGRMVDGVFVKESDL